MPMDETAAKTAILEGLKAKKTKTKFYFNDLSAMVPEMGPREAKKVINKMVQDGILEYWSSGSTTMYGIKGAGIQSASEGES
jgi:hypothetical protein